MIHNTVVYGLSKFTRAALFVIMFKLYGIGREADVFFLAYTIAGLPGGLISFTCELIVGELRGLSYPLVAAATLLPMAAVGALGVILGNNNMLVLVPFTGASIGSVMLAAHLASKGDFTTGPVVLVWSGFTTLALTAALQPALGVVGVCLAVSCGETLACAALLRRARLQVRGPTIPILRAALQRQRFAVTVVFASPALRLAAGLLGTGWLSGVSYVTGIIVTLVVMATTGYRITRAYRRGVSYQWKS